MRKLMAVGTAGVLAFALSGGFAGAAGGNTVEAAGVSFTPKRIHIGKGETVTWKNKRGSHTVTFRSIDFNESISGDDKVSKRFRREGTFRYFCIPHKEQGMRGRVIVGGG